MGEVNMTDTRTAALFFSLLLLSSCSDEVKNFASIEGKWQGTLVEVQVKPFGLPIPFSDDDDSFSTIIEFKADGTVIVHETQPATGTYQIIGDKLIIDIDLAIEGRELAGSYTLETLNDSELVFFTKQKNEKLADPDGGPTLKGDIKLTLHFRKLN